MRRRHACDGDLGTTRAIFLEMEMRVAEIFICG
jgi:hypothetical protein